MLLETEDYGFQLSLIEASFRLFRKNPTLPKEERDLALKWKKEGWDLAISREYLKISGKPDGFDASLREFLTFLNNRVGKIVSLRVTEEAEVFWVHFGLELAVVRSAASIQLCTSSSFFLSCSSLFFFSSLCF
jgi:hypothetical protein